MIKTLWAKKHFLLGRCHERNLKVWCGIKIATSLMEFNAQARWVSLGGLNPTWHSLSSSRRRRRHLLKLHTYRLYIVLDHLIPRTHTVYQTIQVHGAPWTREYYTISGYTYISVYTNWHTTAGYRVSVRCPADTTPNKTPVNSFGAGYNAG